MPNENQQDGRTDNRGNPQNEVIQMTKYLKGADFPASKEDMIACAEDNDAPDEVIEAIESLPGDSFENITDVTQAEGDGGKRNRISS
jgi:hypothetical protein